MPSKSYYYLHTNGELIHKPALVVDSDPQYFDSSFVRRVWTLDKEDRGTGYILLVEAAVLGARMTRILELADKWKMNGEDGLEFANRAKLKLSPDESKAGPGYTCCHVDDDEDAPAGFGSSPLLAMISYAKHGTISKGT